ncbi:MAG: hypothetical protein Q9163_001505 [Psora crenata]
MTTQPGTAISKRRKFVADGVFYAELNEFFQRELAEEGYSGVEVRVTPTVTDIIIRATHTQDVLGEQGRRIRELTSLIQKRFKFPENSVSLYAAKVQNRGLSAVAQCESLRYKLLNGLAVRRACYGVLRFIMESGAKGCEVVVSGKLRAARAKSMKFTDGFMIHSGQPAKDFIDSATRHVLLRQGVLGIKVKIMRGSDPEGKSGPQKSLPDSVTIIEPKEEQTVVQPMSQDYGAKALAAQQAAEQARLAEQQEPTGEGGEDYTQEYSFGKPSQKIIPPSYFPTANRLKGHDDAFAILLAAHHPSLHLLGISTVHGNASLEQTTRNALSILTAIGRAEVPVHPGAAKPFCRSAVHAPDIHGSTGLDGTTLLPQPLAQAVKRPNAVLAMRHALMAEPKGAAFLVATGALTNVALLFATFPEVAGHIKGLSIMGGAIGSGFTHAPMGFVKGEGERFGNHTPWAEFNIYCDPEAGQAIFSNEQLASKTTLIALDLTHQALATRAVQQWLLHGRSGASSGASNLTLRPLFHDLLVFFAGTYRDVFGLIDGPPLHDPIAVAVLLEGPETVFNDHGSERWHVKVVTDGLHSEEDEERRQVGRIIIQKADGQGVRIPREIDVDRFWTIVDDCLHRTEETLVS